MYNDIIHFLEQKRLKEALAQLSALATETENWKLQSEVENVQTTYGYMLQYAAQGMEDPQRETLYRQLLRTTYELADRGEFIHKYKKGYGHLADKFRQSQQFPSHSFQEICLSLETYSQDAAMLELTAASPEQRHKQQRELALSHEKTLDELFDKIWVSTHWTEEEQTGAQELMQSLLIPENDLAVMVSAVTLSLLQLFDAAKFLFLLHTYRQRTEPVIAQRALIGIALAAYYQEKRLELYPELNAALSLLCESAQAVEDLHRIQTLLLLSRETEKIDKKMREEIIPQMMRNPKMMNPDLKITDIEDLEDLNPEWEKDMDKISSQLRELGELQMEGADTYMSTFAQLKSYPFFRQASHWFYPFDKQTPEVSEVFGPDKINEKSFISLLLSSPVFCNSDKYSFCLTLHSIPESQRDMLGMQLTEQNDMIKESLDKLSADSAEANQPATLSRQYIHDLYRFFKLWMFRSEMNDIFKDDLALWKCKPLKAWMQDSDKQKQIADHLFTKGYLEEAGELYRKLSRIRTSDVEIFQKLGFTLQKQKRYEEAISAYLQADMLKPDHIWTLKHLAQCYKRTQAYEEALSYFYKVETMQPDNLSLLLQIGQCLATLRKYDKALAYFFKVEYLDKTPANAQRAIGWCYFMTGKYEDAIRFYQKLLQSQEVQTSDWLNCGHVYLVMGHIPQALEHYREVEKQCRTHDEFMKLYLADKETLIEQNVSKESVYLIPDLI